MRSIQTPSMRAAKARLSEAYLTGEGARTADIPLIDDTLHGIAVAAHDQVGTAPGPAPMVPGVHAVGLGRANPEDPDSPPRLRIYVSPEFVESSISQELDIPREVDGIEVNVVTAEPATIHQLPACTANRRQSQRPFPAGISAGHFNTGAGTIACFCRSRRRGEEDLLLALSNNHVFANVNAAQTGDAIWQPGKADGGGHVDKIAELLRFQRIVISRNARNLVDAALARILDPAQIVPQICSIGGVFGARNGVEGQRVRMHGRTTGHSRGIIADESYDALIEMSHVNPLIVANFVDQIRIEPVNRRETFGLIGDSGSLVVDEQEAVAAGLYFAGPKDGSYGLANPIEEVLGLLEAEIL